MCRSQEKEVVETSYLWVPLLSYFSSFVSGRFILLRGSEYSGGFRIVFLQELPAGWNAPSMEAIPGFPGDEKAQ